MPQNCEYLFFIFYEFYPLVLLPVPSVRCKVSSPLLVDAARPGLTTRNRNLTCTFRTQKKFIVESSSSLENSSWNALSSFQEVRVRTDTEKSAQHRGLDDAWTESEYFFFEKKLEKIEKKSKKSKKSKWTKKDCQKLNQSNRQINHIRRQIVTDSTVEWVPLLWNTVLNCPM